MHNDVGTASITHHLFLLGRLPVETGLALVLLMFGT